MKRNNMLSYPEVIHVTKQVCEYASGEDYEVVSVKVGLSDKNEFKEYICVVACRVQDKYEAISEISSLNGKDRDSISINPKYCHIATIEREYFMRSPISFDKTDSYPVHAEFNEEYNYVDFFFRKFIDFRNRLLESGQVVKDDDIYQYLYSVTGGLKKTNKSSLKEKFVKTIKKC